MSAARREPAPLRQFRVIPENGSRSCPMPSTWRTGARCEAVDAFDAAAIWSRGCLDSMRLWIAEQVEREGVVCFVGSAMYSIEVVPTKR